MTIVTGPVPHHHRRTRPTTGGQRWIGLLLLLCTSAPAMAQIALPAVFSDHMVLQRDQANPVWGWATPQAQLTVRCADQVQTAVADATGAWRVTLAPMSAGLGLTMSITSDRDDALVINDVMLGEVWVCSGQSNMELPIRRVFDADLETLAANVPQIRFINLKRRLATEPQTTCEGQWQACSPETIASCSAIGYYYARRLHQILDVPIGLINNSWGGSPAEAWIARQQFEQSSHLMQRVTAWEAKVATYTNDSHAEAIATWRAAVKEWEANGSTGNKPREPKDPRRNFGYGNIYNSMVHPIAGYGIKGMIWYQGESNASSPGGYRSLFPMVIDTMRANWAQGDFPFYWVQLADNYHERAEPGPSKWAELREVQTQTLDLRPHTGQAVIIDVGRGDDGHPRNKRVPAERLVRWALANDYGYAIDFRSPSVAAVTFEGGKAIVTFDHVSDQGLISYDLAQPVGFAIAGSDQHFVWAEARILHANQIEVWSDAISEPVAVRYGWGDNPRVSLYDGNGLPVTPFRTDKWSK